MCVCVEVIVTALATRPRRKLIRARDALKLRFIHAADARRVRARARPQYDAAFTWRTSTFIAAFTVNADATAPGECVLTILCGPRARA